MRGAPARLRNFPGGFNRELKGPKVEYCKVEKFLAPNSTPLRARPLDLLFEPRAGVERLRFQGCV